MTDPLSVSASISGLITLTDIVFRRTYKYVKAVKKAPKEISALSTEIGALYGILNNLHLVSRQLEHEQAESTTRIHHIHSCYQTLEHVKSILDKDDTSSLHDEPLETLKRKLRWPFTSSEVKDLIATIERHKTTLGLALNVDCMSSLLQALSKHDEIRDTVEGMRIELKERHEAETRIAINNERRDILKSFMKVDPRSNHEMSRKLRSPGTGLWLTEGPEFRQWLETKNARLWFYGIPGAGKTVLAASVIEEALRTSNPSTAIAFFYCDYKDAATQDLSNILGSLAQQFAKQDEESFSKLREFYETHNPEHQVTFKYDSDALLDLVRAVTLHFDCAMIIIDGLDECGTNTTLVIDSLTTLNDREDTTVKTIFLSRDEIEIRDRLEDYTKVSIAARSSDLRLYVAAEIDQRTRKKRLRIRDQALKEHILERLVEGAEGMFRWVTCQMDYLCELPNDAARRKALDSLPPDLNATYERILSRVNQSNPETQKLVRRALRWITDEYTLTTEALCEAVSIDFGNTKRDPQAIPDEFEILHWCSSLVRKSTDGISLELAHFTVQEFLQQIDPRRNPSIGAYQIDCGADDLIRAKVCLTYLNFEDFDQGASFGQHVVERRFLEYPFRESAITTWMSQARSDLHDNELFSLVQKLFSPSKPNTFISWMHDWGYDQFGLKKQDKDMIKTFITEATTLHLAAMLDLTKVCDWLIRSGCDVNRKTKFGTPLHCALWDPHTTVCLSLKSDLALDEIDVSFDINLVDLLLEAGADPNCDFNFDYGRRKFSILHIALSHDEFDLVTRLVDHGAVFDDICLDVLESRIDSEHEGYRELMSCLSNHNVQPKLHKRLLELALMADTSNATHLMREDMELPHQIAHYEEMLRTAAKSGQVEIVTRLLEDHKLDHDAAEEGTGSTALHHAVANDQLVVAQIFMDRGADWSRSDRLGRTALHRSVQGWGRGERCLQMLVNQNADTTCQDLKGMTVWHLAAEEGNVQALRVLLSGSVISASAIDLKANDGRTPLLCASASGSKEAVSLLLGAGSNLNETASDGSSSLHYAAESGNLDVVRLLIGQAFDPCAVTHDESTAVHYAIEGDSENLAEIVQILLEHGVDPCKARKNGRTPLHDLVRIIKESCSPSGRLDRLFDTGRTLLKSLLVKSAPASDMKLGSELIYLACSHSFPGAHETVSVLLELGLDPNVRFDEGRTALMAAAESGDTAIFSTLLSHGADPCVCDSGINALHLACLNDHKEIVVRLRDTDIDWNGKVTTELCGVPRSRVTMLHLAAQIENSRVLKYLLSENLMLNINACTDTGDTPLFVAVSSRAPQNVSLLLSNGADTTSIDVYGNSAIHEAAELGFEDVISEFVRNNADLGQPNSIGLTAELLARKNAHTALAEMIMDYVNEKNGESNGPPDSPRPGKDRGLSDALKVAIDIGDIELCVRIVESGTDLNSGIEGCPGCRPLLYSLHHGELAIAEYLVSQGASIAGSTCEAWKTRGFSAFHYAAAQGSVELLRLLLEKAPSEIHASHDPIHPIHLAVLNGNTECVELMVDHVRQGKGRSLSDQLGTSREVLDRIINMQVQGDECRWDWYAAPGEWFPVSFARAKPLHIAAGQGHSHIVRMLLAYGASLNVGNQILETPLHLAASQGHSHIVGILLAHGASVNVEDQKLATPLHYAAMNGQTAIVKILLDAGANPNVVNSDLASPSMYAALYGQVDSIRELMKGGADLQLRSHGGETALQVAARNGVKDAFVLLMIDDDLCAKNVLGYSALYYATFYTSVFPMNLVLNLIYQIAAYEPQIFTIIDTAIVYRSATEVKMLLRRVPTGLLPKLLNYRTPIGTPLHLAAVMPEVDMINVLLDAGAQLELEGSDHGTPLMAACATGRLATVKLLVARGARTSYVKDGQAYSAFTAAKHHPQIRRWLLVGRFMEGPKLLA